MAIRNISPERKGLYYAGMIITIVGLVTFAMRFGDFTNFNEHARSEGLRAIIGMILAVVGSALMKIGRMGPAGSGLILDPQEARTDIEPWSRMTGGVVKDALDEAGISL